jgi:ribonuclease HI
MRNEIKEENKIIVFSDGGARGNPGPAAIGYVIKDNRGRILLTGKKFIGNTTNNVAEYQAVVEALKAIESNDLVANVAEIICCVDSQLIANQLMVKFKIKNEQLKILYREVRKIESKMKLVVKKDEETLSLDMEKSIYYQAIPREQNHEADALVNQTLDSLLL